MCDQASDMWQQVELAPGIEPDTLWTGAGSGSLILFNKPNDTGATDVKMHESGSEEKSSFMMTELPFSSK